MFAVGGNPDDIRWPRRILQQPAQLANLAARRAEPILCRRRDRRHPPDLGQ